MNTVSAAAIAAMSRNAAVLATAFTVFNLLRVVAYLPTLLAIRSSGQADQHSLFTWATFLGANATMVLRLYEQKARRLNRAICVNACNAVMCAAIAASVGWVRWSPSSLAPWM